MQCAAGFCQIGLNWSIRFFSALANAENEELVTEAEKRQRAYYSATAEQYEERHLRSDDEHYLALAWMLAFIDHLECKSVLDIGSGTGRAVAYLRMHRPELRVIGIEPSADLRAVGHRNGVSAEQLIDGDANQLSFESGSFDLVCEFGVLHHLASPRSAISEMLRVAQRGIFISDDNHFATSWIKRALAAVGLWSTAYWLRSGGKGYRVTAGDGLAYPYSIFDDLDLLESCCSAVYCMNSRGHGPNLRASATHVAAFGVKLIQN
jgi:ubiquinone/menaquinone biosynthesis C-methylase UbiE